MDLLPPDPQQYYEQVWQFVRQVPHGTVVTYGQVAQAIAAPNGIDETAYQAAGSRWVGSGMAICPPDVPWQRVINAQGKISERAGADKQRQLLEAEGVLFIKDKIDLKMFQWLGPGHQPGPRQARLF